MANGKQTTPKRAKAEHLLLDASGNVVEDMEAAHGIRYVHLATGETLDYIPQGDSLRMCAVFGAKTLATNEASQARQGGDDEILGIRSRFDVLDSGAWVGEREGGVALIDRDSMALAAIECMIEKGESQADTKAADIAKMRPLLDDPATLKFVRQTEGVQAAYDRIVGKQKKSVADLAALLRK